MKSELGGDVLKLVIGSMVGFFILSFWVIPMIFDIFFTFGTDLSGLYPIYSGMFLLSGLIVGCTKIVLEEIRELKEPREKKDDNISEKQ